MNKNDLINSLSEETMFSKKDIARVLEAMKRVLVRTLKKGDKVQWSGLGTFLVTKRPQRAGINPATKEKIILAATMVPKFKAGKNLKEQVRTAVK